MKLVPHKLSQIIKNGMIDNIPFGLNIMLKQSGCILHNNSEKSIKSKNEAILKYLKHNYSYVLNKYNNVTQSIGENNNNVPIWVCWWQGNKDVPSVIEMCNNSKVRNANGHPVVILTKDNVKDYCKLPKYIWNQFDNGKMRVQHLTDIIRINLIATYGGIWLDASCYCSQKIDEDNFKIPFFSLKGKVDEMFVSNNQWTTFAIGGYKDNCVCKFVNEMFFEYCKKGLPFIDYYMFDCIIQLGYRQVPAIRDLIDKVPNNQGDCYWLNDVMTKDVNDNLLIQLKNKAPIYKVAWKKDFSKVNENSMLNYLLNYEGVTNEKS